MFIFLAGALTAVVIVFFLIQNHFKSVSEKYDQVATQTTTEETASQDNNTQSLTTEPEGIPLRDLNLSDGQKQAVEKVGIDVETFIITNEMIACAERKLGAERYGEILAGEEPTFLESMSLIACY